MNKHVKKCIKTNKEGVLFKEQNSNYNSERCLLGEIEISKGKGVQSYNITLYVTQDKL